MPSMRLIAVPLPGRGGLSARKVLLFSRSDILPSDRISLWAHRASERWKKSIGSAPEGTMRWKANRLALKMIESAPWEERFLTHIPARADLPKEPKPDLIIPGDVISPSEALAKLKAFAVNSAPSHKRRFYLTLLLGLPLTAPLAILPTPNFPFFYACYRLYVHHRATLGADQLLYLSESPNHWTIPPPALTTAFSRLLKEPWTEETPKRMEEILEAPGLAKELSRLIQCVDGEWCAKTK